MVKSESNTGAAPTLIDAHVEALARLPYGPLFFDRTAALDLRLVEIEAIALADELALLEENLVVAAKKIGAEAGEPKGVARMLQAEPDLRVQLKDLLGRILPVLGNPTPGELVGRVPVAVDLHVTPDHTAPMGWTRQHRIDSSTN